jgi:hypothetical protein
MQYEINQTTIQYDALGEKEWGDETVLLRHGIDLTKETNWADAGFTIEKLFDDTTAEQLARETKKLLITKWKKAGLVFDESFPLDQYHAVTMDYQQHLAAVHETKLIDTREFPIPIKLIETRISEICKTSLRVLNPFDGQSVFHFRVIRPNSTDNNPLHRDIWLEDYDDCINLYIPVAGSNERSSLILLPGSHHWPESKIERTVKGARINGVNFNVPAVTNIAGEYEVTRPSPLPNEVLVFSPYLIHGGAVNLNQDLTRISIEMRLWRS